MRIFNEDKTEELKDFVYDPYAGILKSDDIFHDDIGDGEFVKVFIPYTGKQLIKKQISKLKKQLAESDYKAIKFAEGEISAEEYAPIKAERQAMRAEINRLEKSL